MFKERMSLLADVIEDPAKAPEWLRDLGFNMKDFSSNDNYILVVADPPDCNTACCIGGWACCLFGGPGSPIGHWAAQNLLELNQSQADRLFYNSDCYIAGVTLLSDITRQQAAAAIRRMIVEEGE